jgi:hypothetical protein
MSGLSVDQLRGAWRHAQDYIASRKKVFVVGCAKSGTTWLQNLLNGHPRMTVNGEGRFTWRMFPFLAQAFKAFNIDQAKFVGKEVTLLRDVDLVMCMRMLIDIQLFRYAEVSGMPLGAIQVVGDKTPQHCLSIGLLHQIYPDAKFIHIIRDPRDAATSGWHHFGPDSQKPQEEYLGYFIREVWTQAVTGGREAGKNIPGQYLEIRYEDLHRDETYQIRKCLEFLQVDASAEAVETCSKAGSFKERSGGRERGQEDPKGFYRRGVIADWQNHMTPEIAAKLCEPVGQLMLSCGYDPMAGYAPSVSVNGELMEKLTEGTRSEAA